MEESPDMDDLLNQMESDLIRKTRTIQSAPPLLPPTSIAMQPRGTQQKQMTRSVVTVSKYVMSEDMNTHMEGHVNIDSSLLPNTFQSKPIFRNETTVPETKKENISPPSTNGKLTESIPVVEKSIENTVVVVKEKPTHVEDSQKMDSEPEVEISSEPEPEEISEVEEDTLIPETQIISNLNVTARSSMPVVASEAVSLTHHNLDLDTEMESMLDYLNGVDEGGNDAETVIQNGHAPSRKEGGRDSIDESTDESILSQFAHKFSEEVMTAALNTRNLHYDPAVQEFYLENDSTPDVVPMSSSSNSESIADNSNYLSEPESVAEKKTLASVSEQCEESEKEAEDNENSESLEKVEEKKSESDQNENIEAEKEEPSSNADIEMEKELEATEGNTGDSTKTTETENDVQKDTVSVSLEEQKEENVQEMEASESETVPEQEDVADESESTVAVAEEIEGEHEEDTSVEVAEFEEREVVEAVGQEEIDSVADNASNGSQESSLEGIDGDSENRPRFDSSIATIHVLHESDSDESATPRRERRLTESELQLGKTSPYWIPDSECPHCMLCNTKFTIITRRHHCRACGRVLCGSCCSEKAVLDYLQEEGKKQQAVRVCKPCSTMLARIEAHEQEEQRRRESVASDGFSEDEATSSAVPVPVHVPRGVLKTRSMTQGNEEEGASTSNPVSLVAAQDTSRRSVMFRDGVRPGAPVDETNPEEERSTALKPKKKSRKRTAVVRRIAELKMEDELACALPKDGVTKVLIVKPDSEQPKFENASIVFESLCNFSVVTVVLKKNLNCTVQIFNNPNFGLVWAISTQGFAQIGLDELFFSWTLSDEEKQKVDSEDPELDEKSAVSFLPLAVLNRISTIYTHSTEHEYAGVRRVDNRLMRIHTVTDPIYPLTKHIMFFRPTVQAGLQNMRIPTNPFLIACFLHDDELNWATALPNRLLYKLGEKYNVFPTPFVNNIGRPSLYSTDVSGTVLKVFTDFRSWSYRMRHIPGCTVSLTNDKTVIRIPKSCIKELKEILNFSRSTVAWSCDLNQEDDSVLVCEETDPGLYSTQVFAKYIGQRESTSASFVILDGGSKVNSLQVNVVEDGVALRLQSEKLETILNAINEGHDVVESSKDMEFRVEFVEDGDWIAPESDYYPKSQIDGLFLINKYQYGLSLERALTQVLQVQGISDYGVRMSHVYNLGDGRLQPEEEPKIYSMVETAAKECVAVLEPHIQPLIRAGIGSVSIRLFVSPYEFEYDVSRWLGLEAENDKYKQSLDQLIPMLYNMIEYVPNGFEVEFVLSIVSTKALPI
ncbi:hypothetical protein GCK72_006518 [Caenorhabditis remanei]|uniref:FYVE-type domain-containing protein n=1 Tax=Caenorhabditis remanei TaxID=31234 RepID=A0A6A5HHK1_CAERE|nr:hypothetical protein GCK72_006518 [Caenorhabditis remanei]KAF1766561.1 hypothetical protein GCK72_006518 [Caenorhabditis remanei]